MRQKFVAVLDDLITAGYPIRIKPSKRIKGYIVKVYIKDKVIKAEGYDWKKILRIIGEFLKEKKCKL